MPRTKAKTPTRHTNKPKQHPNDDLHSAKNSERLLNLINTINSTRKYIPKMHNNLPAKLMQLNNPTILSQPHLIHNPNNNHQPQIHSSSYAKSVSSSFSSVMHNGHTHSQGKRIVNESNKPYLEVDEMVNGTTQHFMIPKNTITYKPITLSHHHKLPSISKGKSKSKTLVHSSKTKHSKSRSRKHLPKHIQLPILKN